MCKFNQIFNRKIVSITNKMRFLEPLVYSASRFYWNESLFKAILFFVIGWTINIFNLHGRI